VRMRTMLLKRSFHGRGENGLVDDVARRHRAVLDLLFVQMKM